MPLYSQFSLNGPLYKKDSLLKWTPFFTPSNELTFHKMDISLKWTPSAGPKGAKANESYQWRMQGGEFGGSGLPLIRPDACLKPKFLHRQDRMSFFNWPIFLKIKRGLHFATKLNSRAIRKCDYFWVSSYDLLPLLAKQYFLRQQRLAFTRVEKHVVISVRSNLAQKNSTVLSEPK